MEFDHQSNGVYHQLHLGETKHEVKHLGYTCITGLHCYHVSGTNSTQQQMTYQWFPGQEEDRKGWITH